MTSGLRDLTALNFSNHPFLFWLRLVVLLSVLLRSVQRWMGKVFSGRSFGLASCFPLLVRLVPVFGRLNQSFSGCFFSATEKVDFPHGGVGFSIQPLVSGFLLILLFLQRFGTFGRLQWLLSFASSFP